jgi:HPt (histidine-containing phosphotransfer) domain-containing protein
VTSTHAPDTPLAAAALDIRTVRQLRSIPGRSGSLFDDMAPIFLRTSVAQLDRIADRAARGEHAAAAEAAFQLVGAAGSFGARRMSAAATRVREALRADADVAEALADLRDELAHVEATLDVLTVAGAACPRPTPVIA